MGIAYGEDSMCLAAKSEKVKMKRAVMKRIRDSLVLLFAFIWLTTNAGKSPIGIYNVLDYGAKSDGLTLNTDYIQKTIDDAARHGGGIVTFPAGKYLSGSIVLKDFVVLRLEPGAVLLGSTNIKDYPADLGLIEMIPDVFFAGPLIYAENAQHIGIEGKGIIDGQGSRANFEPLPPTNLRPGLIRFRNCRFVTLDGVSLVNSARWTLHLRDCEDVSVRNIYLNSNVNRNNDGIDVDGCRRVKITGCQLNAEDDAIVLKSYKPGIIQDIVIANCILSSTCSALKIGTETVGAFRNICISNCVIFGSRGIDLYTVDGADVDNITISNITMRDCKSAIQLRLGARLTPYAIPKDQRPKQAGHLRNIMISNLLAMNVEESQDFISGIPGHDIENVVLSDIYISYKGGGTREQALREIPEEITKYPKIGMFGDLPSYGFFIRHVDGIRLRNIRLSVSEEDLRPAIVCNDVTNLEVAGSCFSGNENGEAVIRLNHVNGGILKENRVDGTAKTFFRVQGNSRSIILKENLSGNVTTFLDADASIEKGQVKEFNNLK